MAHMELYTTLYFIFLLDAGEVTTMTSVADPASQVGIAYCHSTKCLFHIENGSKVIFLAPIRQIYSELALSQGSAVDSTDYA